MVIVKNNIENTYTGICTIIEQVEFQKENKSTAYEEIVVLENQPCKLSFQNSSVNQNDIGSNVSQTVKLFISPDIKIKSGSKLIITQNEKTNAYKNSSEPQIYFSHQKIIVELADRWT